MTIERRNFLALAALVILPISLSACSGSAPVETNFPPLNYSYLPPMTLKVASIRIRNEYVPSPGAASLIAEAPEAPALVLEKMAHDRLMANGSPGMATFVIKRASLNEVNGQLVSTMTVELNVRTPDGQRVGYADASVSRSVTAPSQNGAAPAMRAALYNLIKATMADMNVQFQYQVQKSLSDWLAYTPTGEIGGNVIGAPRNPGMGGISTQPLSAPNP